MRTTRRQALRALAAAPAAALFPFPFGCAAWQADEPLSATGEAAAESLTTLALNLHGQLASAAGNGNVLASPWSVWSALAMLSQGARGETREQLVSAMGLGGPAGRADNVRVGARELRARLARANGRRTVSLTTADALWVSEMFDLSPSSVESLREGFGAEVKRRIMLGTYVLSAGYYDAYYKKAQQVRTLLRADFERAFETCDVIATPTCPEVAFRLGEKSADPLSMYLSDVYTVSANLAGIPGASVPCGQVDGLPVGLQLLGRPLDESTVLRVADAYERRTDHHLARPGEVV